MKNNLIIRNSAKLNDIRLYEIADALGIQESYFSKLLRCELPETDREKILTIIEELARKKRGAVNGGT